MSRPVAFEINRTTVSRERFYQVACDPRRSVAVEACAGAGKTWMLVSRMLRALLDGAQPQDILAITFTKKAAAEMRQRLQQWLQEFSRADDAALRTALRERGLAEEPSADQLIALRGLHASLLRSGRSVQVRTFHSWFAALLRNAPLRVLDAMGLPSQYELLENDAQAIARVWRRFWDRVAQDGTARTDYMDAVRMYGRHQAHKALEAALDKRIEFGLADAHGVVDASVSPFEALFPEFAGCAEPLHRLHDAAVRAELYDVARLLGGSALVTLQQGATALEQALSASDSEGILDALLTKPPGRKPRKFSEKLPDISRVRAAQDMLMRALQAQAQWEAWNHQQRMARLVRGLIVDYAALKREQGWIDMSDLERAALKLLSDPMVSGWVQERLDAQIRHVLIDEFQDTNPLQWQALSAWLNGYAGAGTAPSVFIVGDPKQSIYRFRRAEPQVFKAAKEFVVQGLGGDVLSCDHTRRNAVGIIEVVNAVMGQAQDAAEFEGFRPHTTESGEAGSILALPRLLRESGQGSADADAGEVPDEPTWRDSLSTPRVVSEDTLKTRECRQAAQWLQQQLLNPDTGIQPRDVMVLARKRERLSLMQAELTALGIPAQQPEKADLGEMPEVQDIVALLDVLVSPRHDLALARALKSPLFGATDEDLMALALRKRQWLQAQRQQVAMAQPDHQSPAVTISWWSLLHSETELPQRLQVASACLLRWKAWVDSLPPHDALHAIYDDGDVIARMGAAAPAPVRERVLANVRAVLHTALSIDGGRYSTLYGLVRALRAGGVAAPVQADAQAVRLLTVHGAKGLEAPWVLMLDTDGESPRAETMGVLVQWPGEAPHPQRFVFLASETRPPLCVVDALEAEQKERRREELNALYVALTRAQRAVVISSAEPHSAAAQSWWQRLQPHAQAVEVADADAHEGGGEPDQQGTHFTLKALPKLSPSLRLPATVAGLAGNAAEPDSLESRVGQAMHRLLEWVLPRPAHADAHRWSEEQISQVAATFALDAAHVEQARAMAHNILQGDAAWAWHEEALAWWSNEVPISVDGRVLRMDRLVQRKDTGEWWVLDYKSAAQPQEKAALRDQLRGYRDGVVRSGVTQPVRVAFLTAQGALIEIDSI